MARRACVLVLLLALAAASTWSMTAQAQDKPTVPASEYHKWESLRGAPVLSPDGRWLAYRVARVDESFEVRLRPLDGDSSAERALAWGSAPAFAASSAWLAWQVNRSTEEREKLEAADQPVRNDVAVLQLGGTEERVFEAVARFGFDATGEYLAMLGYAPEEPRGKGADLRVLDLRGGGWISFGNVTEYAWSDEGTRLAIVVMTGSDEGNGVQLYDAATGTLRSLDSSASAYTGLSWRDAAADLAVYRSASPHGDEGTAYEVVAWRGLDTATTQHHVLTDATDGLDAAVEVVQHRDLEWAEDGRALALGLRPATPAEAADEATEAPVPDAADGEAAETDPDQDADEDAAAGPEAPESPNVQIWHSADVRVYAEQKAAEQRDARRTLLAVWHLDPEVLVQVGSDLQASAELLDGWRYGIEELSGPYGWGQMFGRPYHDVWRVDLGSGAREMLVEKVRYAWSSTGGDYVLTFDGTDYWSHEVATGTQYNLTAALDTDFGQTAWDTPTDMLPPWGFGPGGWLPDDEAVLLYDEFDIWRVSPAGGEAARLTRGADAMLIHRLVWPRPSQRGEPVDLNADVYLSLRDERTEQRGLARIPAATGAAETLLLEDGYVASLTGAEDADVYVFRAEARDDSPDYFVAGPDLSSPRQVSSTNPWQDDYAWTRAELIDFVSEGGRDLQAALLYPAGYDPSRRYPMIVYTYEILAPQMHLYEVPSERDYYNFTAWTQNGYFVLMPDIVYPWREPGRGAIESVRAAVGTVVERGLVDADRVGLIGHSWGGWQAAYLPTRIDTFAAAVSGAPLTDFVSFMGQLHWNQGAPELSHWETGQARMEVPYWEDPEAHHRSSPIHAITDLDTPVLMAHGDKDGVVEFFQSTLYYNYARRAGKEMVLLVYEDEDHGFRQKANQIDYHRRILEWFGHYLKGEPAAPWILEGIPLAEQAEEKLRLAKGQER